MAVFVGSATACDHVIKGEALHAVKEGDQKAKALATRCQYRFVLD
jgi:hypothetical protein